MIGIILDHNGVVCRGEDFYKERSLRLAKVIGIEWNPEFMGYWRKLYIDASLGRLSLGDYYKRISEALNVTLKGNEDDLFVGMEKLIEGIPDVLRILRRNPYLRVALLSNYVERWVYRFLDKHNIRKYFHSVVVSSSIGVRKPNPEAFKIAAKEINVPLENCIYVGDSVCDLEVCRRLGIRPVFIPGEETDNKGFERIEGVREIVNLVDG